MNKIEITNKKLDELKQLAEAATPGPWKNPGRSLVVSQISPREPVVCDVVGENFRNDLAYIIAAAHPQVVLALVAEIERLGKLAGLWRRDYDKLVDHCGRLEKEADWLAKQLERFCRGVLDCGECGFMEACRGRGKWRQTAREAVEASND